MRSPQWATAAIFIPTAEWIGIDLADEQKVEWMKQVEPPPVPEDPTGAG